MYDEKATQKQLKYIEELKEHSVYPLPDFHGETRMDANNYIKKYRRIAHESQYAIEKGYN